MKRYYFTFGSEGAESGGWLVIEADNLADAQEKFITYYGSKAYRGGCLNYCTSYTEDDFKKTCMYKNGNLNQGEWGVIR